MGAALNIARWTDVVDNKPVRGWKATCNDCGKEYIHHWRGLSDEGVVRHNLSNRGWNVSHGICPPCVKKAETRRRRAKKRKAKVAKQTTPTTKTEAPVTTPKPKVETELRVVAPTPITREQRAAIRTALENHFDEVRGCFLNGQNDQKIGERLNVPWKHVEDIRRAAFGEILIVPGVEELKGDLKAARELLASQTKAAADLVSACEELKGQIADMEKRLRAIETAHKR